MWEKQPGKVATPKKVNIYLCSTEFSATKIMSWKCHMDKKTNSRYDMILGRDLLTTMGLDLIFLKTLSLVVKVHMKDVRHLCLT